MLSLTFTIQSIEFMSMYKFNTLINKMHEILHFSKRKCVNKIKHRCIDNNHKYLKTMYYFAIHVLNNNPNGPSLLECNNHVVMTDKTQNQTS